MNAFSNLPLHQRRPVSIRPVSIESWHRMPGDRRATHRSATASFIYITRDTGRDAFGTLDFRHRDDLVATGLELPLNHPSWAKEPGRIWAELDAVMGSLPADEVSAWHMVLTLPQDQEPDAWVAMVRDYVGRSIARFGPAVSWAIHAKSDGRGGWKVPPHVHCLIATRRWRHDALHGLTVPSWCGPAMRARLHADWLSIMPQSTLAAAVSPYRVGGYTPAAPDCAAIENMFDRPKQLIRPKRRVRRRPSKRIRKERNTPLRDEGKTEEGL